MYVDVRRARSHRSTGTTEIVTLLDGYEIVVAASEADRARAMDVLLQDAEVGDDAVRVGPRNPHGDQVWRLTKRVAAFAELHKVVGRLRQLGAVINTKGLSPEDRARLEENDAGESRTG